MSKHDDSLFATVMMLSKQFHWSFFPVRGKHPTVKWKPYQNSPAPPLVLEKLFDDENVTGAAVITGPVSGGLVIRDFDSEESYQEWKYGHPELAEYLPTVRTARGRHIYFLGPSYYLKLHDGEYRGTNKQYTLAAGSMHPSGIYYQWTIPPGRTIPRIADPVAAGLVPVLNSIKNKPVTGKNSNLISPNTNSPTIADTASMCSNLISPVESRGWLPPRAVLQLARIHQPLRIGERNQRILDYVRALQRLSVQGGWTTFRQKVAFREWFILAQPIIGTKDESFSFRQFLDAWGRCPEQPAGLDISRLLNESASIVLPPHLQDRKESERLLLRACLCLQRYRGGDSFYLSGESAGRLFGVGGEIGRRKLVSLCRDGLLERIAVGNNITGRASTYRCTF